VEFPRNDVLAVRGNFYGLCSVEGFGPWDERRSSPAGDRDVVVGFVLHFWALTYRIFPSISIFPNRRTAVQLRRVLEGMNCHNVEVCASRNTQRSIKRRERQNQCDCG
jgi:hypothetical protein